MDKVTVESVTIWMLLAGLTALFTYILYKRGKIKASTAIAIPIFVFYLAFVLTITIIERVPRKRMRYNLELFWTVKAILSGKYYLISEIFWNVIMFIPIGALFSAVMRRHPCVSVIMGVALSVGIEVVQLVTHRGLFEFDDIIHNAIGALIGVAAVVMIRRRWD